MGCKATIEAPVPCLLDFALKLQTTKSPFLRSPEVIGATVKPYGFCAPFCGSTADPMTTCFLSRLSSDTSEEMASPTGALCERAAWGAAGVMLRPMPPLQPAMIKIAASENAPLRWNSLENVTTEAPQRLTVGFCRSLGARSKGSLNYGAWPLRENLVVSAHAGIHMIGNVAME